MTEAATVEKGSYAPVCAVTRPTCLEASGEDLTRVRRCHVPNGKGLTPAFIAAVANYVAQNAGKVSSSGGGGGP